MRRRRVLAVLAAAVAVWAAVPLGITGVAAAWAGSAALPIRAASPRALAMAVPGLRALNADGNSQVSSVSCGSAGNCAAGGYYTDRRSHGQGFVIVQRNGVWRRATRVPGLGALNAGGLAQVYSVSCASAGNCAAGGSYTDRRGRVQGFVVSQRNWAWGRAIELPGLGALNAGGYAHVYSVSCASTGNCAAEGSYLGSGRLQEFVVSQRSGVWRRAARMPVLGGLIARGYDQVSSVSCGSAGNCAVAGSYYDRSNNLQAFVAVQRNWAWGRAIELPGLGALNKGGHAQVSSLSCGSAGNCAVGGSYTDRSLFVQGFVAVQRNGVWGRAIEVPGLGGLNKGRSAYVSSVSCGSAGNCAAAGQYADHSFRGQGFVAVELNGVWRRAIGVPGLSALNKGGSARVSAVSCRSAGNCAAAGQYADPSVHGQGFVAVQRNGVWRRAIEVPGLRALNKGGDAQILSVSCGSTGNCAAAGFYLVGSGHVQAFVVSQRNGVWHSTIEVPAPAS